MKPPFQPCLQVPVYGFPLAFPVQCTLHTCLHVEACPGCGRWVAAPSAARALGVPVWSHRDDSEGSEDQEAPGLGHDWVPDKQSKLGWEPSFLLLS